MKVYFAMRLGAHNKLIVRVGQVKDDPTQQVKGIVKDLIDLNPRNDLYNHSPDGFEAGYLGSGPAQLALAILADYTGNDQLALQHYQDFKSEFLSHKELQTACAWHIYGNQIEEWLNERDQKNTS